MRARYIFTIIILSFTKLLVSQTNPDPELIKSAIDYTQSIYVRSMEGTHHIYNGSEYIEYQPLKDEHPYFLTEDWAVGEIKYSGQKFTQVPMMYDINQAKVVLSYYYSGMKMQLVNDWVDEFTFEGHRFINFKPVDSLSIKPGYYEVLYDGNTKFLAKRSKRLVERIEGTELIKYFETVDKYFMLVNGQYNEISGKRDMIKALVSQRKELKAYIRKHRLFENEKEQSAVQLATYFDSLTP